MSQLKEHIELLVRIGKYDDYIDYLRNFYSEVVEQQSTELKEIE